MNRITRFCCSLLGMAFLITSLLIGIWNEVDPFELIQRALFGGGSGLLSGFIIGKLLTLCFTDWDKNASLADDSNQVDVGGHSEEERKLQPWNPPHISKEDQGRQ